MSRSGYSDDCGTVNLWRGAVDRAIAGKRGQAFLREMALALDNLPVKELIADEVVRDDAHVCAIGSVALARRLDISGIDIYDGDDVAARFGIARALACEIAYENDECGSYQETSSERWSRMRAWVDKHLMPVNDR
jgi:hypothetical protein